jgi:galactosamine-6-phosphate isomerase
MKPEHKFSNLKLEVTADYVDMSRSAAALIISELKRNPDLLLCASAGGTPTLTYELLAKHHARNSQLFNRMKVLQIDEWGGIPSAHPASCRSDLKCKLVDPIRIQEKRFISFSSDNPDPRAEVERVATWLARHGPIDICILGLGTNGHVAMNEPADALTLHTHVTKLAPSSLKHGMLKDLRPKPSYGLTIGMADILCSRKLLLLVSGKAKSKAMSSLLKARVSTHFPASFVWLHPDACLLCDHGALP